MNIVKKILYAIIILCMLLVGFLVACHFNPGITDAIAKFLYGDNDAEGGSKGLIKLSNGGNTEDILGLNDYDITPDESYPFSGLVYEIPDIGRISVPANVAGKVGYDEPVVNVKDIDDTTADEIESSLGTGPLGDELSYEALFYPYYYMLDDNGKSLYKQVVANANALNEAFRPNGEYTLGDIKKVMEAVYNDHPELFFVDTAYTCKNRGNGAVVELDLSFNKAADDIDTSTAEFNEAAENILAGARSLPNAFEQEKYVHDVLSSMIDYDLGAPMNQSAYSALVKGETVCAGYARAMQYLMQRLVVPCYYCAGYAGENHAWNIIQLDDDFYNVDVTWDDTNPMSYDYFNKSDSNYATTHARKRLSINLPACNGTDYQVASTVEAAERDDEQYDGEYDGAFDGAYDEPFEEPSYEEPDDGVSEEPLVSEIPTDYEIETYSNANSDSNQVVNSIEEYYSNCRDEIESRGLGSYSFTNIINGEDVYAQWERAYNSDAYKDEYLKEAMTAVGAKGCQISLSAQALSDGKFLITHNLVLN